MTVLFTKGPHQTWDATLQLATEEERKSLPPAWETASFSLQT